MLPPVRFARSRSTKIHHVRWLNRAGHGTATIVSRRGSALFSPAEAGRVAGEGERGIGKQANRLAEEIKEWGEGGAFRIR